MLFECKVPGHGFKVFVLAPSWRWAKEFCDRQLRGSALLATVRLVRLLDSEILPLRSRIAAKDWGTVQATEISAELQRAIRLAARRHIADEQAAPGRPVEIKRAAKWLYAPTARIERANPWTI